MRTDNERKAMFANMTGKKKKIFSMGTFTNKSYVDPDFKNVFAVSPMQRDVDQYMRILRNSNYDMNVLKNLFQHQITVKYPDPKQWSQIIDLAKRTASPEERKMLDQVMASGALFAKDPKYKGDRLNITVDLLKP